MALERFDHVPVLPEAILELLAPSPGETVVDATVGAGGHARLLAEAIGPEGQFVGIDVDVGNLRRAESALSNLPCRMHFSQANFSELGTLLGEMGIAQVDVLLADLGISSTQLDDPIRGFSFQYDGPLDMRIDPRLRDTAADLVNRLRERELADVFYQNAQEMASRRIARFICEARRDRRITTTGQLTNIVCDALGIDDPTSRKSKAHPATRTFLALRMAVNDELGCLKKLLDETPRWLRPGGRFGVIAFHSVEDKPVKLDFRKRKVEGIYEILTKKPVVATPEERDRNPRSRSAKLRVAKRLGQ